MCKDPSANRLSTGDWQLGKGESRNDKQEEIQEERLYKVKAKQQRMLVHQDQLPLTNGGRSLRMDINHRHWNASLCIESGQQFLRHLNGLFFEHLQAYDTPTSVNWKNSTHKGNYGFINNIFSWCP